MDTPLSIEKSSAATLGTLLHHREINAIDLTEYFIDRISTYHDTTVFTATCFDRARREAKASAARYQAGRPLSALDGVPVAWKDLFDVAGLPTTAGSAVYRHAAPATVDAPIVQHLTNAGMITLGKTNLSEFAYSSLGLNPHFGTPHNPLAQDVARAPGGSSSGSAVAVAAGLIPISIGTDTGGSVRTPAAFNGIVGYKSSEHHFNTRHVFPLSLTLDTIGVLAHDVRDCQLLDLALRGLPAISNASQTSQTLETLRLVIPENAIFDHIENEVRANFMVSIAALEAAGANISWRVVPELDDMKNLIALHGNIAAAEAYWFHRELIEGARHIEIDPTVYKRILGGKAMQAIDFISLLHGRVALQRSLWESLGDALLVMPTVPHVAPPLAPLEANQDYFAACVLKTITNTILGSMLNTCGLALPNGVGAAHMPTSILFSAQNGREEALLQIGSQLAAVVAPAAH